MNQTMFAIVCVVLFLSVLTPSAAFASCDLPDPEIFWISILDDPSPDPSSKIWVSHSGNRLFEVTLDGVLLEPELEQRGYSLFAPTLKPSTTYAIEVSTGYGFSEDDFVITKRGEFTTSSTSRAPEHEASGAEIVWGAGYPSRTSACSRAHFSLHCYDDGSYKFYSATVETELPGLMLHPQTLYDRGLPASGPVMPSTCPMIATDHGFEQGCIRILGVDHDGGTHLLGTQCGRPEVGVPDDASACQTRRAARSPSRGHAFLVFIALVWGVRRRRLEPR